MVGQVDWIKVLLFFPGMKVMFFSLLQLTSTPWISGPATPFVDVEFEVPSKPEFLIPQSTVSIFFFMTRQLFMLCVFRWQCLDTI